MALFDDLEPEIKTVETKTDSTLFNDLETSSGGLFSDLETFANIPETAPIEFKPIIAPAEATTIISPEPVQKTMAEQMDYDWRVKYATSQGMREDAAATAATEVGGSPKDFEAYVNQATKPSGAAEALVAGALSRPAGMILGMTGEGRKALEAKAAKEHPIATGAGRLILETPPMLISAETGAALLPVKFATKMPIFARILGASAGGGIYGGGTAAIEGKGGKEIALNAAEQAALWGSLETGLTGIGKGVGLLAKTEIGKKVIEGTKETVAKVILSGINKLKSGLEPTVEEARIIEEQAARLEASGVPLPGKMTEEQALAAEAKKPTGIPIVKKEIPIIEKPDEVESWLESLKTKLTPEEHKSILDHINTLKKEKAIAVERSEIDPLTGLKNRVFAIRNGLMEGRTIGEGGQEVEGKITDFRRIIMMDIDHFKKVNDVHGHPIGDGVLRSLGKILKDTFGDAADVVRYGGEEIAAFIKQSISDENALKLMEKVRQSLLTKTFNGSKLTNVGISAGFGRPIEKGRIFVKDALEDADKQLYLAKQGGRGQTFFEGSKYVPNLRRTERGIPPIRGVNRPPIGGGGEIPLAEGESFRAPTETAWEKLMRLAVNKFRRVETIQKTAVEQTKKPIEIEQNVDLAQRLFPGLTQNALQHFKNTYVKPLTNAIARTKLDMRDVQLYVYAKHAPERNARIAEINPDKFNLTDKPGSGLTNEQAQKIITDIESRVDKSKLDAMMKSVQDITEHQRNLMEQSGLETPERVQAMREMFPNYVPAKGWGKETLEARGITPEQLAETQKLLGMGTGKGFSLRGKTRVALGRTSLPDIDNIFSNLVSQTNETVVKANKQPVGEALLNFVKKYENKNLYEVEKPDIMRTTTQVYDPKYYGKEDVFLVDIPVKPKGGIKAKYALTIKDKIYLDKIKAMQTEKGKDYVNNFLNLEARNNPQNPVWMLERAKKVTKVMEYTDPRYLERPDVVVVKSGGEDIGIRIHDEGILKAMKNLGSDYNSGVTGKVLMGLARMQRFLAMTRTSLSPEFILTNFARDIQTAMANVSAEEGLALAAKMAKDVPGSLKGMFSAQGTKAEVGKLVKPADYTQWAQDWMARGGKVEFFSLKSLQETQKELVNAVNRADSPIRKYTMDSFKAMGGLLQRVNSSVESGVRISYYKNVVQEFENRMVKKGLKGAELEKAVERYKPYAASKSKALTVDFNQKGELGAGLNALYLFANASIQGTKRMFQMLQSPRGKQLASAVAVLGYMNNRRNRLVAPIGEDGVSAMDKINDFNKYNYINIFHEDGTITRFPLPYGLNAIFSIGGIVENLMSKNIPPEKATADAIKNFINAFNPLGGSITGLSAQELASNIFPTWTDPIKELGLNKDYAGNPIHPESPFTKGIPESQQKFKSTSEWSKKSAEKLNEMTGGTKYESGWADIYPSTLDYFAKFIGGGLYNTVGSVVDIATKLSKGKKEDIRVGQIPFVRKIVAEVPESYDAKTFYNNLKKAEGELASFETMKKSGDIAAMKDFESRKLDLLKLEQMVKDIRSDAQKAQKEKNAIEAHGGDTKKVDEYLKKIYITFNKEMNTLLKARR